MKTFVKFLVALSIVAFAVNTVPNQEPVIALSECVLLFAVFTALIVPSKFFNTGHLNVITDVKVWEKYIIEKLRKVNDFLRFADDDSASVLGGAVVYIPQSGSDPEVEKNVSTYPGVAVQRTDSDVNYVLDVYRTKPSHVPWAEIQTISYDKIDSVVKGHTNVLAEAYGDDMLIKWAPTVAGKIVATTGDDVDPSGNQAGVRKGFDEKDLRKVMNRMNVDKVPQKGRIAIIDANMYGYFYDSLSAQQFNAFNQFADNANGIVGRLHGFDIMMRSTVAEYANGGATPNAFGAAELATDNLASLCWHPDMVTKAIGQIKPFQDKDNPLYYGDLWSMIMRAGGRKKRADNVGVYAIVQGQ
jgi:hypothetical protein